MEDAIGFSFLAYPFVFMLVSALHRCPFLLAVLIIIGGFHARVSPRDVFSLLPTTSMSFEHTNLTSRLPKLLSSRLCSKSICLRPQQAVSFALDLSLYVPPQQTSS
jgi:hypothetical protein